MGNLKKMFDPSTVALIGATDKVGSPGRGVLENLLLPKNRKVFPVNPSKETVLGLPCYKRITDIPDLLDLAVIITPAETVPQAVEECGQAGVQGVVIISAGFREVGNEGMILESRIEEIRKKYRAVCLGAETINRG